MDCILYLLHLMKFYIEKYKINIYLQDKYAHDPGGKDNYQIKEYLKIYKKYEYSFQ